MANIGKNIRTLRNREKMTQDELAEKLFVSRQSISNYENGKSFPDVEMIMKIAEIMKVDANALIYGLPVSVSRKSEIKRAVVGVVLTVVFGGTALFLMNLLHSVMRSEWMLEAYWFFSSVYQMFLPLAALFCGWTLMQLAGVFFHAKRPKLRKSTTIIRKILMVLVAVFTVLWLFRIVSVAAWIPGDMEYNRIIRSSSSISCSFNYSSALMMFLTEHNLYHIPAAVSAYFLMHGECVWILAALMFAVGIFLWSAEPSQRKIADAEGETVSEGEISAYSVKKGSIKAKIIIAVIIAALCVGIFALEYSSNDRRMVIESVELENGMSDYDLYVFLKWKGMDITENREFDTSPFSILVRCEDDAEIAHSVYTLTPSAFTLHDGGNDTDVLIYGYSDMNFDETPAEYLLNTMPAEVSAKLCTQQIVSFKNVVLVPTAPLSESAENEIISLLED